METYRWRARESHSMFPHSERPSGHLDRHYTAGTFTRPPPPTRSYYSPQTPRTQVNNYNGPQRLQVYDWKRTLTPVSPMGPPVTKSLKRQYGNYSPYTHVKRQRIETSFHSEEGFPLFQSSPHSEAIAGTSQSTSNECNRLYPSPPPHCPVPNKSPDSLQIYAKDKVSAKMLELFEACQQQTSDLCRKETFRTQLQKDIHRLYPDARLYLTGSTMSGLGCRSSDADMCLVVRVMKHNTIINILCTLLRLFHSLSYVNRTQLIKAKVPILRFKEKGSNLEFDLNINNTVGIRNTFLLKSYTNADIRIRPIMLVIKKWAQHCEINDASKGTLSSYTLALMALHYLQIVKDPVLPSLQKDHPNYFDPSMDLDIVPDASQRVPRYISENKSSLGELFLGFLKYYANFSWDNQIISVREGRTLPKSSSPQWSNKFICVEEPFERRNVARAVYEKAKFDTIKAKFAESYQILQEKNDLNSLLPLGVIIHKERTGR